MLMSFPAGRVLVTAHLRPNPFLGVVVVVPSGFVLYSVKLMELTYCLMSSRGTASLPLVGRENPVIPSPERSTFASLIFFRLYPKEKIIF